MKQQVQQWCENHRGQIAVMLNAIATVVQLVATVAVRTLWGATALLAYVFYNATPDDTLYGLAQFAHQDRFWVSAFALAVVYSVVIYAIHGPQSRVAMSAGATATSGGMHSLRVVEDCPELPTKAK